MIRRANINDAARITALDSKMFKDALGFAEKVHNKW